MPSASPSRAALELVFRSEKYEGWFTSEGRGDCLGVVFEEKLVGGVYGDDLVNTASERSSVLECDDAVDWVNGVPCDLGRWDFAGRRDPSAVYDTE